MASPLLIKIALHYYITSSEDCSELESRFEAQQFALSVLLESGLLERIGGDRDELKFRGTDALKVWVEAICAVPFPVQQWVIPEKVA
jgi:hypothetical protein